jgi:hypothetical protein
MFLRSVSGRSLYGRSLGLDTSSRIILILCEIFSFTLGSLFKKVLVRITISVILHKFFNQEGSCSTCSL